MKGRGEFFVVLWGGTIISGGGMSLRHLGRGAMGEVGPEFFRQCLSSGILPV